MLLRNGDQARIQTYTKAIALFRKRAKINFCRIKVAANNSTEFPNEAQLLLIFSEGFNFRRSLMARAGAEETKTQNQN